MTVFYVAHDFVDSTWYLQQNPDLAAALQANPDWTDRIAATHYALYGAAEQRAPNSWFDATYYQTQNPDLHHLAPHQLLAHFTQHGMAEGRAPNAALSDGQHHIESQLLADYVLQPDNHDLKKAVETYTNSIVQSDLTAAQSALVAHHFFRYGQHEDRQGGIADLDLGRVHTRLDRLADTVQQKNIAKNQAEQAAHDLMAQLTQRFDLAVVSDGGKWDIQDVQQALEQQMDTLGMQVRMQSNSVLAREEPLDAESLAFARAKLQWDLTLQQRYEQVLKDSYGSAAQLHKKMVAYQKLLLAIEQARIDAKAELAKWQVLNPDPDAVGHSLDNPPDAEQASPELIAALQLYDRFVKQKPVLLNGLDKELQKALKKEGFLVGGKEVTLTEEDWVDMVQQVVGGVFNVSDALIGSFLKGQLEKINANKSQLLMARQELKDFDQSVQDYQQLVDAQQQLQNAQAHWQAQQEQWLDSASHLVGTGYDVVLPDDALAQGQLPMVAPEANADLFIYSGQALEVQHFNAQDSFYFGALVDQFHVLPAGTVLDVKPLGGAIDQLDMFALQQGADTILVVETVSFADQSANPVTPHNADFIFLQLQGVNAHQLHFADGWLTLVA